MAFGEGVAEEILKWNVNAMEIACEVVENVSYGRHAMRNDDVTEKIDIDVKVLVNASSVHLA